MLDRLRLYVAFTRPFTLLPPTLGVVSGAATAFGSALNMGRGLDGSVLFSVVLGSLCAALLNAASNVINQIYDLPIDRVNKPSRPLCTGAISIRAATIYAYALYAAALLPTWLVVDPYKYPTLMAKARAPFAEHQCIWIYLLGLIATFIYSAPGWGRTKARGWLANWTIAIPRGCLLKVAGWSMVASVFHLEPWFIGVVFLLFLLGAATTKDFSDMEGDRAGGCDTLPLRYGVRKAAWVIAPFFVLPWLLVPLGIHLDNPLWPGHRILTGNPTALWLVTLLLLSWGAYTLYLIVRRPEELATSENHPSWTHMYLMMMAAQLAFLVAYLV